MDAPSTIEDIMLARILPIVEDRVEARLEAMRREMAREFLYTKVSTHQLAEIIDMTPESIRRKRKRGELPFSLDRGNYVFDLKEIQKKAHECNFSNPFKVREAIELWINRAIQDKI